MQRIREYLSLFLLAALPFHALFVTVGTLTLVGPGNAPLTELALWKEAVLGVILCMAFFEWLMGKPEIRNPKSENTLTTCFGFRASCFGFDVLDYLIFCLLGISIALLLAGSPRFLSSYIFGFKYDFVPLLAFVVLRRVSWSADFLTQAKTLLLTVGGVVAGYGVLTSILPQSFFVSLGYSELHSLYLPDGPVAAFQQIGGSDLRRIQSTMSGPNQLGLWLLLPWSIALTHFFQCDRRRSKLWGFLSLCSGKTYYRMLSYVGVIAIALLLTFSRAAWIGAFVSLLVILFHTQSRVEFQKNILRIGIIGLEVLIVAALLAPNVIFRLASSKDHLLKPIEAMATIVQHPFGLGLGTAGPASNRSSDACVHLPDGADASWAAVHKDLCVFVETTQVQPTDRLCSCPFVPENWYLQIGVEMGVVGFLLFVALVYLIGVRLWSTELRGIFVLSVFLSVSTAALFLHAWEDAALAYSVWLLLAALLPLKKSTDG